jgi:hypothetical protein
MFPACLSIKSSRYPKVNTSVEVAYFIDNPGCLYLHGLDRKRKRGATFGHIHKARTAEQCHRRRRCDPCHDDSGTNTIRYYPILPSQAERAAAESSIIAATQAKASMQVTIGL